MACEDRQLTEAQRQAGYQNQRTGVQQAVRPFSGRPTLDNLIDYINRELQPAVRRTRDAVNDVYLQVADNAPSGNPLAYYFSTETGAADPTVGRIRLDASPQNTATTIRISQTNARLADVTPWLDVMAGSSTTPLGVVTLSDAINPGRAIRFDLGTMTDQGDYWDLGVTVIESTHPDPFVEDEAVVLAFIPGVASTGTTVPPGALTPIGANTVLGNPTASTAAPTEIAIAENSLLGRAGAAGTGNIESITVPGTGTNPGEVVFVQSSSLRNHVRWAIFGLNALPLMPDNRFLGNISGATARPAYTDLGDLSSDSIIYENVGKTFVRQTMDGDVFADQNSNVTLIQPNAVSDTKLRDSGPLSVIGNATGSTADPGDISAVNGSGAVLRESGGTLGFGTIATAGLADDSVTNAKLAEMAANTVKANATSGAANPTDFAVGANTVLGRVAGDIVSAQLVNAQITDATIANAKLANMAQSTIKGRAAGAGTGDPQDLTAAQVRAIVDSVPIGEVEETGAGPFNDYAPSTAGARHILCSNAAGVFTGVSATNYVAGDEITFSHQGTGYTEFQHNTGSSAGNVFFTGRQGRTLRIFDNEIAVFRYVDTAAGVSTVTRWELQSPLFPWAQSSADAAGDITMHNGTNYLAVQPYSTSIVRNGTTLERAALTGDVTASQNGNATTIANDAVTDAKLRNSAAVSVIGRSANSTGDPADIAAGANDRLLARTSDSLAFQQLTVGMVPDGILTNAKLANMTAGAVKGRAIGAGTGAPTDLTGLQTGDIVRLTSGSTGFISGTFNDHAVTDGVHVLDCAASGGNVVFTGFAYGSSNTGAWFWLTKFGSGNTITIAHQSASSAAGNRVSCPGEVDFVMSRAGDAVLIAWDNTRLQIVGAMHLDDGDRGDVTVSNGGATWTIDNDVVSNAKLRNSAACSVIGRSVNSSGDPADIAAASNDLVLTRSSNTLAFTTINTAMIADGVVTTGKLAGIGANTVIGNDTGASTNPTAISIGTNTVLGRVAGNIVAAQVATGQIADAAVTLAKQADLAQSRIIGRAEGAGTGVPTALTPTQVVSIIDGEAVTWTGSHTFNGAAHTVNVSGAIGITSSASTVTLTASSQTILAAGTTIDANSPTRLQSSVALTSVGSTATTAANNLVINDVTAVRFTGPADPLTGMVPVRDGQIVLLVNAHATNDLVIQLEATGSSTAANCFSGDGTDRHVKPGEMALAWYDGTSDRWRLLCRDEVDL